MEHNHSKNNLVQQFNFSCRKRYHRSARNSSKFSGSENEFKQSNNDLDPKIDRKNICMSTTSNSTNKSLLKRRVIYSILAVCITLSKSSLATTETDLEEIRNDNNTDAVNCTKAAVEEFPADFLTPKQRQNGGVIIHFLIATYLIFSLGSICDDYFVPVLEIICNTLHLSDDVAGATFMAAGTSAPEFFTNIMGTFVTKSDLGIGTIVGSAVFNIFGVISVCGIFAGRKIPLDWYPITRDCVVYGITVFLLIIVLLDEKVFWYESIILLAFYFLYIGIMFANTKIERWAFSTQRRVKKRITNQTIPNESTPLHNAVVDKGIQSAISGGTDSLPIVAITSASMEIISDATPNDDYTLTVTGNDYRHMLQPQTSATPSNISDQTIATDTTLGSDANLLPAQSTNSLDKNGIQFPTTNAPDVDDAGVEEIAINSSGVLQHSNLTDQDKIPSIGSDKSDISKLNFNRQNESADVEATLNNDNEEEDEQVKYPWQRPDKGFFAHLYWAIFFPMELLFFLTIPDVRRLYKRRSNQSAASQQEKCCDKALKGTLVWLNFTFSIVWIGAISYVVTWMITIVGFTMSVPDTVMGLSFLAVGTSIPEVISSHIVCKQGKGSMAVSNAIGSNSFDILICLGLPWMIKAVQRGSSMLNRGEKAEWFVEVHSKTLNFTVGSLFASVAILYIMLLISRWIISRLVAFACLAIYLIFLTISLVFELNLFPNYHINPQTCPSTY